MVRRCVVLTVTHGNGQWNAAQYQGEALRPFAVITHNIARKEGELERSRTMPKEWPLFLRLSDDGLLSFVRTSGVM